MTPEDALERAFREDWGRIVATLIGGTGDWDLAEESAQEAFARALPAWRRDGVPAQPRAWLTTAARNHAVDRLRRAKVGAGKLRLLAAAAPADPPGPIADDRLRLIFTCCHPALGFEAQVTLALRTLCGLSVAEIARAFAVSEATMAKRLVRTRKKIVTARIPYRVPPADLLPARTAAVLGVVYLLFSEGYAATSGPDLIRPDLCTAAVRLAAAVADLLPDDPEALGLYALLLLQQARSAARVNADGDLVALEEQDRRRWSRPMIDDGLAVLRRAVDADRMGPYQLQALIAGCHATAPTAAATDWRQIAGLYDDLLALVPSPTVRLNRAIAVGMATGPAAGLALLDDLSTADVPLREAARADLLRRAGRAPEAAQAYERALTMTHNQAEQRYLRRRLATLG